MKSKTYYCQACKTPLQTRAVYCFQCYAKAHVPCPNCMEQGVDRQFRVRRKGKGRAPVDCGYCNNERFILDVDKLRQQVKGK